jgi:hypothetical protein
MSPKSLFRPACVAAGLYFTVGGASAWCQQPSETVARRGPLLQGGVSAGLYFEAAEGNAYSPASALSLIGGVHWSAWGVQFEYLKVGRHCANDSCMDHSSINVGIAHRNALSGASGPQLALVLGCCVLHAGLGVDIPVARVFISPGVDLNWNIDMASARFRIALALAR